MQVSVANETNLTVSYRLDFTAGYTTLSSSLSSGLNNLSFPSGTNGKFIQIKITNSGTLNSAFEIGDITLVYREGLIK